MMMPSVLSINILRKKLFLGRKGIVTKKTADLIER